MEYRYLKAFLLTAKHLNFSKAARELRIAQSAVSRQIRLFEEDFGHQLFMRSKKSVAMTPEGKRLFLKLNEFEQWQNENFNDAARPQLRIGALPGVVDSFLVPRIISNAMKSEINFQIVSNTSNEIENLLHRHEIDVGLSYQPSSLTGAVSRKLYSEQVVLIGKENVDVRNLQSYCWIHMGNAKYLKHLSNTESEKEIIVNSIHAIISLVKNGIGIAVVPYDAAKPHRTSLSILGFNKFETIYLSYIEGRIWNRKIDRFLKKL